ncbi:hypothetical protein [uncultured Tateyamaria sp.]|uniref:hypothetical protein n=1 Tax=uncultured Tateyamaria sp. TaxID=455651 RepID=UPI00262A512E|nr:hypothetical protein [uncultured Tateyamaria sp.]
MPFSLRRTDRRHGNRRTRQHRSYPSPVKKRQSSCALQVGTPHQICGDEPLLDIVFNRNTRWDYRSAQHDDPNQNAAYNDTLRGYSIFKSPGKLCPSLEIAEIELEQTGVAFQEAVNSAFLD